MEMATSLAIVKTVKTPTILMQKNIVSTLLRKLTYLSVPKVLLLQKNANADRALFF